MCKPFLKWVGGKTQILDQVLARFPAVIHGAYHEPFVGGGSVLLGLLASPHHRVVGQVHAYDANETLIHVYKNLQRDPQALIAALQELSHAYLTCPAQNGDPRPETPEEAGQSKESFYYWIREAYNAMDQAAKNTVSGSARFIFLNKTGFRGLYRVGPRGLNVPFGNYARPDIVQADHLMAVSALIQRVVFECCDFRVVLSGIGRRADDFVYLDPPYVPERATSFVGYTAHGFEADTHTALFVAVQGLPCGWLMSNADVPAVHTAFPDDRFAVDVIACRRAIHSKRPDAQTNELLIRGRGAP